MSSKSAFFKQSFWMISATLTGGLFLYAVHIPAVAKLPPGEYSVFATLLQFIHLMMIPSLALQTIFTEHTAAATTAEEKGELTGAVRTTFVWTFGLFLLGLGVAWFFQDSLLRSLKISNPAALWMTLLTGWSLLWLPMMQGMMAGVENFAGLGWLAILNGTGRFALMAAALFALRGHIVGVMAAVLIGMMLNLLMGAWHTARIWNGRALPMKPGPWLRKAIPMTLGLGAIQTMFSADMVAVQGIFPNPQQNDLYGFAGTIARGLLILTTPLVGVMFPKAVPKSADGARPGVLTQALAATGLLGCGAALGCSLFPTLPIVMLGKTSYLPVAPLIPLFCFAMLPLVFSNVLISYLMARRDFKVIPWAVAVVAAYLCALGAGAPYLRAKPWMEGFRAVVLTLGAFNLLLLVITAAFCLRNRRAGAERSAPV